MQKKTAQEVAKARFLGGETLDDIAKSMGISRRTLQRWANGEVKWADIKAGMPSSAIVQKVPDRSSKRSLAAPRTLPTSRLQGVADELSVLDDAIAQVSVDIATDMQGKGQLATALVRLYERREKLQPQTLEQLLEVIATWLDRNGMDLKEFAGALKLRLMHNAKQAD